MFDSVAYRFKVALGVHNFYVKANNCHIVPLEIQLFESTLEGKQVLECVFLELDVCTMECSFN